MVIYRGQCHATTSMLSPPATVDRNIDNVPEILKILTLFHERALDHTPELVQGLVLEWECCPEREVRDCFCARAQEWSGLAIALLEQCKAPCEATPGVTAP